MDVQSAGIIDSGASGAELAHQLLYGFNVLILTDGGYKFYLILASRRPAPSVLTPNGRVTHQFPLPVSVIPNRIGVISAAHMGRCSVKISGNNLRRCCPCQTGHLNFYPEILISQSVSPSAAGAAPTAEEIGCVLLGFAAG